MEKKIIMPLSASNIRELARKALRGHWKNAALATLLYMVAVTVPSTAIQLLFGHNAALAATMSLFYLLLTAGAFTMGYSFFVLEIFRRKNPSIGEIFSGFSRFGRALGISVVLFLIIWALLIPGVLLISIGIVDGGILSFFLGIAGLALFALPIRASLSYAQVFFVALDNEEMQIMEVLRESKFLMEGNRMKLFLTHLSFIGWTILCVIPNTIIEVMLQNFDMNISVLSQAILYGVAGIGFLWLNPYTYTATAGFYEIISGNVTIKHITGTEADSYGKPTEEIAEDQKTLEENKMLEEKIS